MCVPAGTDIEVTMTPADAAMDDADALRALEFGRAPQDTTGMTPETHWQAMMCTKCALAGEVPPDHFPQTPGLWGQPCPRCNEDAVWVTEIRAREEG